MVPGVSRRREDVREQHGEGDDDAVNLCGDERSLRGVPGAIVEHVTEILNDAGTQDVVSIRPLGDGDLYDDMAGATQMRR